MGGTCLNNPNANIVLHSGTNFMSETNFQHLQRYSEPCTIPECQDPLLGCCDLYFIECYFIYHTLLIIVYLDKEEIRRHHLGLCELSVGIFAVS